MNRLRAWRRYFVRPLVIALIPIGAFVALRYGTGNQGTMIAGSWYRSAQLSARGLERAIRDRKPRTILNLRGANPDQPWYRAERAQAAAQQVVLIDVPLASDHWLSRAQAAALVDVLDTAERPVLVHCEWGAERTGLIAAWAVLLDPAGSLEQAQDQFSLYYMFLPLKDGRTMRGHLDQYASWLAERGLSHHPDRFRSWVKSDYQPGWPSREDWPYDPYPLAVVVRPEATPELARRGQP